MTDIRNAVVSNVRGGCAGLLIASGLLMLVWFVAFMVAFGNPGPLAEAYLPVAGLLLSGIMPVTILVAGYLAGSVFIRK